jgi:aspartate/methionine/tyrosine aminotransferase
MNFQEFKSFRDKVTQQQSLLRLDCMNPFKAMSFLKYEPQSTAQCSSDDVLGLWAKAMNVRDYRDRAIPCEGVRESLKSLFNMFAVKGKELWLPEDVYPFYWEAAHNTGLKPLAFSTLPTPSLDTLEHASANSVVIITNPVSPLGRVLSKEETDNIKAWLNASKDRQIVLDTVYSYSRGFDCNTMELFETGQCFIAHSLSKAWLERGIYGVLLAPKKELEVCKDILVPPTKDSCYSAFTTLEKQNNLPEIQQSAFSQEWARLTPAIQKLIPNFQAPKTGYFATINARYDEVLKKHNVLVIPSTVFGSSRLDLSVISCLYSISSTQYS